MVMQLKAAEMRPPSGASAPTQAMRLADTGTTEDNTATALTASHFATILVGTGSSVRVAFGGAILSGGTDVATTDLEIPAGGRFDWWVDGARDDWVAVEAGDGAAAYECWVWTSSGPRATT